MSARYVHFYESRAKRMKNKETPTRYKTQRTLTYVILERTGVDAVIRRFAS